MYTDIQLEAIKIFGRKDLTEGCLVEFDGNTIRKIYGKVWKNHGAGKEQFYIIGNSLIEHYFDSDGILGHIPHLEDLFRVAIEKGFFVSLALQSRGEYVLSIYGSDTQNSYTYTPTIPLLDQPSLPEIVKLFS